MIFQKPLHDLSKKTQHDIIQNTTKEKKSSKIITSMEIENRIIQGNALHDELFRESNKKFNPKNLQEKVIKS